MLRLLTCRHIKAQRGPGQSGIRIEVFLNMNFFIITFKELNRFEKGNCLNFRHVSLLLFNLSVLLMFMSCGKVVNQKRDYENYNKNISFLLMEKQCTNKQTETSFGKSIRTLYEFEVQKSPQLFFNLNPRSYNYESPLILSKIRLETAYQTLKSQSDLNPPQPNTIAEDIYYLFNESRRFEDQKCSFINLTEKKKNDIRPYLNIAHHCYKKFQNEICDESEYQNMDKSTESWTRENAIELCNSFEKKISCQVEYLINLRNNSLSKMINRYYLRFQEERYSALFKLRTGHQKYKCQKSNDEKTIMTVKVLESSYSHERLVDLLHYVEKVWTNSQFALKIELVTSYSDDVVTLIPTSKGISYVPDDNNRLVYLSSQMDNVIAKQVLSHEFGHVLGFPDCYIEFFDNSKKELVYYEISPKNTNIMCSLKAGVKVEDDYFKQLAQNSCLFN